MFSCKFIIFFLFLTFTFQIQIISSQNHHSRRILHQPFLPVINSISPSPSPSPNSQPQKQQPKFPFDSQSPPTAKQNNHFFPADQTQPPPPPSATSSLPTFPANISSLIVPNTPSSKPSSRKLIAIAVSLSLLSAALITVIAAFLLHNRRRRGQNPISKEPRSDSLRLVPPNATASDAKPPPPPPPPDNPPNTSSEFIYVGKLSGSRKFDNVSSSSSISGYQKLDSPELRPLPPLPKQNLSGQQYYYNSAYEEDEEEFFSPRGSSGSPNADVLSSGSPNADVLSSGRLFRADNFRSRSFNSGIASDPYRSFNSGIASDPSSQSASPNQTMSTSPSVAFNSSPRSLTSKSPDSVVNFPAPLRPIPPPPPRERKVLLPSPPSSPPERTSGETQNSPERVSDGSVYAQEKLPPRPPPLPPPRFWEMQPQRQVSINGPPVLAVPSRPVVELQKPGQNLESGEISEEVFKPKLKPLHWDKVRASSDRAMVWDQLKSSSFQLNEEMIETLFMVNSSNLPPKDNNTSRPLFPPVNQENRVLDPKKSQNISILLRALNVTIDEVCEALLEGNTDTLGTELLESLLKMAPTKDEERKLKEFKDTSPFKLGPAEKFLKAILDIPFAFQRVNAMLYITNFDSEVEYLERSFETLEAACEELRHSRMFMKLLEAVLKTGNRMNVGTNRGDARAFKLDTLLKLVDVKGTDGKTTLLHFVVQEIIRAEGSRLSGDQSTSAEINQQSALRDDIELRKLGLQVVSSLSGELTNVKKSAAMDSDILSSEVAKLSTGITRIVEVLKLNEELASIESSRKFSESVNGFLKKAEEEIIKIQAQESVALSKVKEITEYFHGNSAKEEAHPFRIFLVVRDFLSILDQVCKEAGKINERTVVSSARQFPLPVNTSFPPVFPGLIERQYSSSGDESSSSL